MKYGLTIFLLLVSGSQLFGQISQGESLPLYYDARNGNVTIDTSTVTDGVFTAYTFSAPLCCSPGFLAENHLAFMNSTFVTSEVDLIGETNFSGIDGGIYSLGNILPSGLTQSELRDSYFGRGGTPFDGRQFNALGRLGSGTYHLFEPIYSPSPFPAINDGTVGVVSVERWADNVSLIYDSSSGVLTLDSTGENGGAFWSYQVIFEGDVVNVDEFVPLTEDTSSSVRLNSLTEIGFSSISEGVHGLGPILPTGLSETEFSSMVQRATFIGKPGSGLQGLDFDVSGISMSIAVVPEPSGSFVSLFGIGLIFLVNRHH